MARLMIGALVAVGLLLAPAQAVVLIDNNPNVSDGGLNMAPPGAWAKVGGGNNARLANDRAAGTDGGDWAVGGSDGTGSSPAYNNYYFQTFAPPFGPGVYDVDVSGWSKAWAGWWGGENFNWIQEAHIDLVIDGVNVWTGTSSNNTNRDTWTLHSHASQYTINSSVEVRLRTVKGNDNFGQGGLGAIFFDSRFDDVRLSVVPEPASLLLFGLAGLPLLLRRRRR